MLAIILAYILDLIVGDPTWLPHPVRLMGWAARALEERLRHAFKNERAAGIVFAALVVGVTYFGAFAIIYIANTINTYLGIAISVYIIYAALAIKDLRVESMRVYHALKSARLELARKYVGLIVGRDTNNLSEKDIIRAAVETVSENIVDGIISPIFYAALGGAPLALAYKAVNTLDSMVGYKNERYGDFGWASARVDDFANFIPARMSSFIVPIACKISGLDMKRSFRTVLRDRKNNPSPNSGIPEAAMAGALGVRLGGLNYYGGIAAPKPYIGDEVVALNVEHIALSSKVAYRSALVAIIMAVAFLLCIYQ